MQMENVPPFIRVSLFIAIMLGVVYGGYYFLFHPIPVEVAKDEEVIPVQEVAQRSTQSTQSTKPTQQYATTTNKAKIQEVVTTAVSSLKKKEVKQNPPNYLIISKIGVSAPLEYVKFDGEGNMATPSGPKVVAWYGQGAKIGSVGNAVISGHRDTEKGKAVFYRLGELTVGNTIMVTDDKGKGYKYIVDSKNNYPKDSFPSKEIFSNGTSARLNLVTCSGIYNRTTKSYSHRLVVSAVLAK